MKDNKIIRFQEVVKTYPGNIVALDHLTFDIVKSELVFLAGPSGAGKSTILKLIAGIEIPTSMCPLVYHASKHLNSYERNTTAIKYDVEDEIRQELIKDLFNKTVQLKKS